MIKVKAADRLNAIMSLGGYSTRIIIFDYIRKSTVNLSENINPLVPRVQKIKIHQSNFELTFNDFICKGNGLSQCSL